MGAGSSVFVARALGLILIEEDVDNLFGLQQSLDISDFNHPPPATGSAQDTQPIPDVVKVLRRQMADARNLGVIDVGVGNAARVGTDEILGIEVLTADRFAGMGMADIESHTRTGTADQLSEKIRFAGPAPGQVFQTDRDPALGSVLTAPFV